MKLRSITLSDVRQFTRPVIVAGLGDGLNVLSAPNESGKSTLFDAIQAMFTVPHRSTKIAPLRPTVGGNPEIILEIDHAGARHTLHKKWGRGGLAEVSRDGRLIAKGDEAEAFINALMLPADEGGPAGLLWVKQGLTALDQGSKSELAAGHNARRDLLSSVTGEFEALTGGKRMDRALTRAREDLDLMVTQRGAKAGGPYDAALKTVRALEDRRDVLTDKAARLRDALDQRRLQRRVLADLSDPVEAKTRTDRLSAAQAAFEAATRHNHALQAAQAQMQAAQQAQAATAQRRDARISTERAVASLIALAQQTDAQETSAATAAALAETALRAVQDGAQAARTGRRDAETRLNAALRAAARQGQAARHAALVQTLAQAEAGAQALPALRSAANTGPDARALEALDSAQRVLSLAEGLASAAAPRLTLVYASADTARALLNGQPLAADTPIPERSVIDLPGYGRLTLDPGRSGTDPAKLTTAREGLSDLLARLGVQTPDAARAAARARQQAEAALRDATADLKRLAPDGIDALREACARLAPTEEDAPGDTLDAAQEAANRATQAADDADLALEAARTRRDAASAKAVQAKAQGDLQRQRLTDAQATLAALPDPDSLALAQTAAETALQAAQDAHARLAKAAPDLTACSVAFERARDVVVRTETELREVNLALVRLDTLIDTQAGDGIDEELADTDLQLTAARATVAAQERELAVLRVLIAALETAQSSARDRYFAPVLTELRPMLALLWPDAELRFDGDSLLPSDLIRDGHAEPIGTLSGGTREQIALLVRLAFARLLARSGTPTPIILDDALVYTDDDRIERMFDALHAQAGDLQILVLSCRNRALRALGGHKLTIEPLEVPL